MFPRCPKCGQPLDAARAPATCPKCGLVFEKYLAAQRGEPPRVESNAQIPDDAGAWWQRFLEVPAHCERWQVYGRTVVYVLLAAWGWRIGFMDIRHGEISGSFMHGINLVFHEAGHVFFMFFGRFLNIAGGTLGQWLVPIIVGVALHWKNRDNFGASLALWWLAVSFMDAAPYAWDAADPVLPLLGGGTGADRDHDWIIMLGDAGLLQRAHGFGRLLQATGWALMLLANFWGAVVLRRQFRNRVNVVADD
jgi:hypothetical protein